MTEAGTLRGAALLQRGAEDLVAAARGMTGTGPAARCSLGTGFQIASVTKQFTAAAVLLLADRGVLSVHDPVGRWLDGCPAAWGPVTVHHLLSHSAGLVHWPGLPGLDVTRPVATSEKLRVFAAAALLSPPGERYSYSSPGYVLLAHILERATGVPYGAFLAREIFEPLGMAATFNGSPGGRPGLAAGRHGGAAVPSFDLDTVGLGTGSIWSTAGDLARWGRALAGGEIFSQAARRAMFTVHVPVEDDDGLVRTEGYGYGWFIGSAAGGHRIFYHPGDNPGYRSINAWFPDDGLRLVVLSNEDAADLDPIVHDLIRTAFPATGVR
ncbi:MAG TPA: serine hydrolase domain-containing protein [Streptosporangiaceae bacterium]|nr:serine hydrolase domain-containing protein [Streptosporangiaceae bacterium]